MSADLEAQLGGREAIERIIDAFYDKVYAHPWLSRFFQRVEQAHQARRLRRFVELWCRGAWSDPADLRFIRNAHAHIVIPEAVFELREQLWEEAVLELGYGVEVARQWRRFDERFKSVIVKRSADDCDTTFGVEEIIDVPPPER